MSEINSTDGSIWCVSILSSIERSSQLGAPSSSPPSTISSARKPSVLVAVVHHNGACARLQTPNPNEALTMLSPAYPLEARLSPLRRHLLHPRLRCCRVWSRCRVLPHR